MMYEKAVGMISVSYAAMALFQMMYPVLTSISNMCWEVRVYNVGVDFHAYLSGFLQTADVSLQVAA